MKLVTNTAFWGRHLTDKQAITLIKQAGFDGYDFSLCNMYREENNPLGKNDYLTYAHSLRAYADEIDIPCLQAHAPFGYLKDEKAAADSLTGLFRSIEIASVLGCPVLVVHPGNNFTAQQNYDYIYSKILPFAKQANVKIATENMWNLGSDTYSVPAACGTAENFIAHVDIADDPYMVACLDIGHAHMEKAAGAPSMIKALGKERLRAVHIHDNDLCHDNHTLPFLGRIDWYAVIDALKEINYQGNFTFETDYYTPSFPDELLPDALKLMERVGRWFIKKIKE